MSKNYIGHRHEKVKENMYFYVANLLLLMVYSFNSVLSLRLVPSFLMFRIQLGGCPRMAFGQTLRIFRKIMLAILRIWLCLFCENFSIVTKILILGQPPRRWKKITNQRYQCL